MISLKNPVSGIRRACAALAGAALLIPALAASDAPPDAATAAFFEQQVRPLLKDSCLKCHGGGEKLKGGLYLTSRAGVLQGGDTGPAVDLAKPEDSLLLKMISWSDDDHQMPPKEKLPKDKLEVFAKWVKLGAPWSGEQAAPPPATATKSTVLKPTDEAARNYWAYKKPVRPAVPTVADADKKWVRNPIDAFVIAKLEAKGIKPVAQAERRVLIRRATYDLIGLPPTPDEVDAFVKDAAPDAYEKLIDRLLASPHYGEKWGRYWLDLVGYAETNGYERDGDKPHAWRYRDYVINAFNSDKPYDQFLEEQLAGDELAKPTADSITATGYYRLGIWDDEPADHEQAQYDCFDGIVSTTAQAMLGMTMGCARCHNHKKDPILQDDYYRMLAFFHAIKPMATNGGNVEVEISHDDSAIAGFQAKLKELQDQSDAIEDDFRKRLDAKGGAAGARDLEDLTYKYYRGAFEKLPKFDELKPESEGKLPSGRFDTSPTTRDDDFGFVYTGMLVVPADGTYAFNLDSDDGSRLTIGGKQLILYDGIHGVGTVQKATVDLKKGRVPVRLDYFQHVGGRGLEVSWGKTGGATRPLTPSGNAEAFADIMKARGTEILGKEGHDRYRKLQQRIAELKRDPPGVQKALAVTEGGHVDTFVLSRGNAHVPGKQVEPGFPQVLGFPDPPKSSKPRLALAQWMADPANPLPARVMANRIWQFHFGKGIVSTANDFGGFGQLPSDQALLDWLACEFVEKGWRIKAMHKLLMTSSAYRLGSQDDAAALAKDPEDELVWRNGMRRLTGEEIRDSILAVNGSLNLSMAGPSVFPPMPAEVLATSSHPESVWGKSSPEDSARRSVYIKVKRSLLYPILAAHDFADTDTSCPMRFSTTVPTQALTMLNSAFMGEQAAQFAKRLRSEAPMGPDQQVRLALRLATQRPPLESEVMRGLGFMLDLQKKDNVSSDRALDLFCLLVLNLNEFVYLD